MSLPELYDKYYNDIFKYAFSILRNSEDSRDAAQETFIRYAENERSFKGNCSQKTYLLVITRNYCYNKIQTKDYNNNRIDDSVLNKSYLTDYDSSISLHNALSQLTSDQNELIFLKEFGGYSYKEIADLTEQSLENVKIKLFRARKKLRELLT